MAILVIFRFQCNPILFLFFSFSLQAYPKYWELLFLYFLNLFNRIFFCFVFWEAHTFFFFGKQSGKSVRVTLYTLLQLSLGTRVPNTKRTLFTSCSHTRHVPVCNSKAICWGSLSPVPSPFQNCLLFWWDEFLHEHLDDFVLLFQKRLTIQGKTVDMHYSHPRNKYEDWLCSTVS